MRINISNEDEAYEDRGERCVVMKDEKKTIIYIKFHLYFLEDIFLNIFLVNGGSRIVVKGV